MEEARITSIEGSLLRLWLPSRPTGTGEPWSFMAELDNGHGKASAGVWEFGPALVDFFRGIARDWGGWEGSRTYSSMEGQLEIGATHDGHGQVLLTVSVGSLEPPSWRFETSMRIGAGAHAESIASDVEALLNRLE